MFGDRKDYYNRKMATSPVINVMVDLGKFGFESSVAAMPKKVTQQLG